MKNKTALLLMEQLVMVLIFALAAAACLRSFAGAHHLTEAAARREEAAVIAQNAAEALKSGRTPEEPGAGYLLEVRELPEEIPGLAKAQITVSCDGESLFTLTTGWQEVRQ